MEINHRAHQAGNLPRLIGPVLIIGLAFFLTSALIAGLTDVKAALVAGDTYYVSGSDGIDDPACGTQLNPCQTISYTLGSRVVDSDTILIAGGTYTENLTVSNSITLKGGYDPATWERTHWTTIDGSANGIIPGEWDGEHVRYPYIIKDGSTYKMWYGGFDFEGSSQIGYATSPDGVVWTRSPNPVVELGGEGAWNSAGMEAPFVIKESATSYRMWYTGFGPNGPAIGYATSADGVTWQEYTANPVITAGTDDWNNVGVLHPSVIEDSGTYTMYLLTHGNDGSGDAQHISYATSTDGVTWTLQSNLFEPTWEIAFWRPYVLKDGNDYRMWYSAWANNEGVVTYATSTNGLNWTKHGSPVLTGTLSEWDEGAAVDPAVIPETGGYTLWYDNTSAIGRATSSDGISWTKPLTTPVFTGGTPTVFGQPVITVANPSAVVNIDGRFTITGGGGEVAGGVDAGGANVSIRNSAVLGNFANGAPNSWAGGGVVNSDGVLTIDGCWIGQNRVQQGAGGVRVGQGTLAMTNTIVYDNYGDFAVHLNGSASLMNVTISGNDMGLLFNSSSPNDLSVTNTIIYGNGSSINNPDTGTIAVSYSDIEGGWTGTGNIDADPLFIAPGNFKLQYGSPAIDSGTNAGAPDVDIEGTQRPVDGDLDGVAVTDMGALEFVFEMNYLPIVTR